MAQNSRRTRLIGRARFEGTHQYASPGRTAPLSRSSGIVPAVVVLPDDQHPVKMSSDFCSRRKVLTTVTKSLYEIGDKFLLDIKAQAVSLLREDVMADIKDKLGSVITAARERELMAVIESELNARITMEDVVRMLMDAPRRH
jgi:hypothetical protein